MIDWNKRKEEIEKLWFEKRHIYFDAMFDEIIAQEQEMIKQFESNTKRCTYVSISQYKICTNIVSCIGCDFYK